MSLSKYRWALTQSDGVSGLHLIRVAGPSVLDTGSFGYVSQRQQSCICETKVFADQPENFPSIADLCSTCVAPVPIAGCCENCFQFDMTDLSDTTGLVQHAAPIQLYKTLFTNCFAIGSALDKQFPLVTNPPHVLHATFTSSALDNQLHVWHTYSESPQKRGDAFYSIISDPSCTKIRLQLVSTSGNGLNWPNIISMVGIPCPTHFIILTDDPTCTCTKLCVDFQGMIRYDPATISGPGVFCQYDNTAPGSGTFATAHTKVCTTLQGCYPIWSGQPFGAMGFFVRQIGETSAILQIGIDVGDFTFTCGTSAGYYNSDNFSCLTGGIFKLNSRFDQFIGDRLGVVAPSLVYPKWPETVTITPFDPAKRCCP